MLPPPLDESTTMRSHALVHLVRFRGQSDLIDFEGRKTVSRELKPYLKGMCWSWDFGPVENVSTAVRG